MTAPRARVVTRTATSWDPVHDSRRAFRVALAALSSPGQPAGELPPAGIAANPLLDRACALALSVLDPGITLSAEGEAAAPATRLLTLTGAATAPSSGADYLLACDGAEERWLPRAIECAKRGSRAHPYRAATVIAAVAYPARAILVHAPGWDSPTVIDLPMGPMTLLALANANSTPPMGVDVFLITPAGLIALPRYVEVAASI